MKTLDYFFFIVYLGNKMPRGWKRSYNNLSWADSAISSFQYILYFYQVLILAALSFLIRHYLIIGLLFSFIIPLITAIPIYLFTIRRYTRDKIWELYKTYEHTMSPTVARAIFYSTVSLPFLIMIGSVLMLA